MPITLNLYSIAIPLYITHPFLLINPVRNGLHFCKPASCYFLPSLKLYTFVNIVEFILELGDLGEIMY
jgi:hypothetical protein